MSELFKFVDNLSINGVEMSASSVGKIFRILAGKRFRSLSFNERNVSTLITVDHGSDPTILFRICLPKDLISSLRSESDDAGSKKAFYAIYKNALLLSYVISVSKTSKEGKYPDDKFFTQLGISYCAPEEFSDWIRAEDLNIFSQIFGVPTIGFPISDDLGYHIFNRNEYSYLIKGSKVEVADDLNLEQDYNEARKNLSRCLTLYFADVLNLYTAVSVVRPLLEDDVKTELTKPLAASLDLFENVGYRTSALRNVFTMEFITSFLPEDMELSDEVKRIYSNGLLGSLSSESEIVKLWGESDKAIMSTPSREAIDLMNEAASACVKDVKELYGRAVKSSLLFADGDSTYYQSFKLFTKYLCDEWGSASELGTLSFNGGEVAVQLHEFNFDSICSDWMDVLSNDDMDLYQFDEISETFITYIILASGALPVRGEELKLKSGVIRWN